MQFGGRWGSSVERRVLLHGSSLVQAFSAHALKVIHLAVEYRGKLFTFSNLAQTQMDFWSIHVLCKKPGEIAAGVALEWKHRVQGAFIKPLRPHCST